MAQKTFYMWATILSPAAGRVLASSLIERGYGVSGMSDVMLREGEASTLIALKATSTANSSTIDRVLSDFREIMSENSAMYHSLVVYDSVGKFSWIGSNIKLPVREEKKAEIPKEETRTRFDVIDS
jgi:hypothetical protein